MKILFLTPWYPDEKNPNHGIFVREQALALSMRHEVVVISSKIKYKRFGLGKFELKESSFQSLKEYRLVINRSIPVYNQFNYFQISTRIATKVAHAFKPDIIHGNIGYPGGVWSWIVSKRVKKPFVITEHTFIYNNFRSFIHKKLTLSSFKNASAIITVSTKAADEIRKYINRPVRVVPNIVDFGRFSIKPFLGPPIVIGFLGGLSSLNHVKGLDVLLRVLSKIDWDFVFLIGGTGTMVEKYQALANQLGMSSKCKFVGFVPPDGVPEFMNKLHFFVNASRFESFGIAIAEAMASGLPAVCYDNGGPSDFVSDANGILVENQNEQKLKEAIEWMLVNYQTYDREKIKISLESKFSKSSFVAVMESVYEGINS